MSAQGPIDRAPGPATGPGRDELRHRLASCEDVRRTLALRESEEEFPLAPAQVEHLAVCEGCRVVLAQAEPTALFSVLALETKPEAFWTGFETRVLATVREEQRAKSGILGVLLRPRALGLAFSAAALAVVALLVRVSGLPSGGAEARRAATGPAEGSVLNHEPAAHGDTRPAEGPLATPGAPGTALADLTAREAASPLSDPLERDAVSPAPVETVSSPTARVLTINVKDPARDEADVVVIVDQGIDI